MGKRVFNVIIGCVIVNIGVVFLSQAHLVTGGTTGIALGVMYLFHISFAAALMLVSIPFYVLSIWKMGWQFTISSFLAVVMLSLASSLNMYLPQIFIPDYLAAIVGGALMGLGLSFLFWNQSSLGGINVLALYLQKDWRLDPGKVSLVMDSIIVLCYFYYVGLEKGICSIVSVIISGLIISYFKEKIAAAI